LRQLLLSAIGERYFPEFHDLLVASTATRQAGENSTKLMQQLPKHSHLRKPLLHYLAANIHPTIAASLFGVSPSLVKASLLSSYDPSHGDLFRKYTVGTRRSKIPDVEKEVITDWIKLSCPPRSGSASEIYRQYHTDQQLYQDYVSDQTAIVKKIIDLLARGKHESPVKNQRFMENIAKVEANEKEINTRALLLFALQDEHSTFHVLSKLDSANDIMRNIFSFSPLATPHSRSLKVFNKLKSQIRMRRVNAYWRNFDCFLCISLPSLERKMASSPSEHVRYQVENAREHVLLRDNQFSKYRQRREALHHGELLLVLDFGTLNFSNPSNSRESTFWTVLVIVCERRCGQRIVRSYFDVFSQFPAGNGSDFFYLRAAWLEFTKHVEYREARKILCYSDGGGKDFKNRFALAWLGQLCSSDGKSLEYEFKAPHHGHSLADAHIGTLRDVIKNERNRTSNSESTRY
jgi:hypothetical protein